MREWTVHHEPTIPNFDNHDERKLQKGQVIAIEPFASTGGGIIKEGKGSSIYSLKTERPVRDANARKVLTYIQEEYKTLPFSKRAIAKQFPLFTANTAINTLMNNLIIHEYAQLPE